MGDLSTGVHNTHVAVLNPFMAPATGWHDLDGQRGAALLWLL
jgi:hypothetical protein